MKRYLLIAAFSVFISSAFAQYCDILLAEKVAINTIAERFDGISRTKSQYKIKTAFTQSYNDTEVFHIFNLEPQGFVIIAADQSVVPVLAFSTESDFYTDGTNPAAEAWIQNYAVQIESNIKNNVKASSEISENWLRLAKNSDQFKAKSGVKSIAPMLTTKWDQGRYFNSHCPSDPAGTDGHVVVGCVATALGQLMNYFRYPSTGTGSYGYEHPDYGWLEVNFAEQSYNYDQMPQSPTDYNEDLARLLYNIGVSVDMNYGPDGSGMYNHKGAYTLKTYFGYNAETTYFFRDSVDAEFAWTDTLVMLLDQNIPLYYAGWSDYVFVSGHAFILDGYSDETHYHINWGWGGSMDGYFMIDDLTPSGSDFTLLHELIAYAVPASAPQYCNGLKELNTIEGILEDGSGPIEYYQNDIECSWLINPADSVSGIGFEFLKFICDDDDYLIIYDGATDAAPVLATFYGSDIPTEFESASDQVLIKFVTGADSVNDGWLLKYSGIKPDYCSLTTTLTSPTGTITDGSNSFQYQNNEFCNWTILPTGAENILITFEEFDIEPIDDFVKILNSSSQTAANLSGNEIPEPVLIIGHKATVSFRTDDSGRSGGFKLHYEINTSGVANDGTNNLSVYPNPADDKITILTPESNTPANIKIYSLDGKTFINEISTDKSMTEISTVELSSGIYIIEISTENSIERVKFVKK
jgi:hypothetical protein